MPPSVGPHVAPRSRILGSGASGSVRCEVTQARNETFDVVLTVSDTAGNSASATRTVTE
ncbi:hypothetical protein ACKVMT_17005 [Halobacteriales archaeon Cl-PHB]